MLRAKCNGRKYQLCCAAQFEPNLEHNEQRLNLLLGKIKTATKINFCVRRAHKGPGASQVKEFTVEFVLLPPFPGKPRPTFIVELTLDMLADRRVLSDLGEYVERGYYELSTHNNELPATQSWRSSRT